MFVRRNKRKMGNRPKLFLVAGFLFAVTVAAVSVFSAKAQNFIGPQSSAGVGQGAIGVDSSYNLAVGTTTTQADTKLLIVGTSTTSGYYAIKVINLNTGPLFVVRSDGSVSIGSPQIQSTQSGSLTTITGVGTAPPNGSLFVNGPIFTTLDVKASGLAIGTSTPQSGGNILLTGSITALGTYSGTVNAGNISAGGFGGNSGGGNFSFPGKVTLAAGNFESGFSGGGFYHSVANAGMWGGAGYLQVASWVDGTKGLYINTTNGSIGIGTVTPNIASTDRALTITSANPYLELNASTGSHAQLRFYSGGVYEGGILKYADNHIGIVSVGGAPVGISVNSGASDAVTVISSGNVGIGTTGPGVKLHVLGSNNMFKIENADGVTANQYAQMELKAGTADNYIWTNNQNSAGFYGGSNALNIYGGSGSPIAFFTNAIGTPRVVIDTAGNVGIGTSPSYNLDVVGNGRFSGGLAVNGQAPSATTGLIIAGTVTRGIDSQISGTSAANYGVIGDAHGGGAGTTNYGLYGSATNGATANYGLYIVAGTSYMAGNVGIGTTGPGTKLHIIGNDNQIKVDTASEGAAGIFLAQAGANQWELYDYADKFHLYNYGTASDAMTVLQSNGNVGIGTTGPDGRLNISGGTSWTTNGWNKSIRIENGAAIEFSDSGVSTKYGIGNSGATLYFFNTTTETNLGAAANYWMSVNGSGATFTQPVTVGTPTAAGHATTKSYVDSIVGGGGSGGSFTTLSVSGAWNITGAAGASLNLNGYNISGVNKLTVTTIDPVYEIGGVKYATYGADTVGLKVETYGKGTLVRNGNKSVYVIDFANAERGSDIWLFWQTIAEGTNMEDVVVSLTPEGGNAQLWYVLRPQNKQIAVYGSAPVKFSYHLVAPRHDTNQFGNILVNSEEKGTMLPIK